MHANHTVLFHISNSTNEITSMAWRQTITNYLNIFERWQLDNLPTRYSLWRPCNNIGVAYRSIISHFCLRTFLSTLLKVCKKTDIFRAKYVCYVLGEAWESQYMVCRRQFVMIFIQKNALLPVWRCTVSMNILVPLAVYSYTVAVRFSLLCWTHAL